ESPEPLVSKGTAGEGIDDLGAPIDDEHDVIEDETGQDSTDADSAGAAEADSAASAKSESAKGMRPPGSTTFPSSSPRTPPTPMSCRRPGWSRSSSMSAIDRPHGWCRTVRAPLRCAAPTSSSPPP